MGMHRLSTGIAEIDRVFGGGITSGSTTLISGPPGVGKSSLMFVIADGVCKNSTRNTPKVTYVSGEQSLRDLDMLMQRLNIKSNICTYEGYIRKVLNEHAEESDLVVIDSLNTVTGDNTPMEETADFICSWSKQTNVPVIIVCHVNKDGEIAVPSRVEWLVDGVFDLDPSYSLDENDEIVESTRGQCQLSSGSKYRFGECGVSVKFDMTGEGLKLIGEKL